MPSPGFASLNSATESATPSPPPATRQTGTRGARTIFATQRASFPLPKWKSAMVQHPTIGDLFPDSLTTMSTSEYGALLSIRLCAVGLSSTRRTPQPPAGGSALGVLRPRLQRDGFGLREEQFAEVAATLAKSAPDAIFCVGNPAMRAAQESTRTVPIVGLASDMEANCGVGILFSELRSGILFSELSGILFSELRSGNSF
jgi:hypothetical protein